MNINYNALKNLSSNAVIRVKTVNILIINNSEQVTALVSKMLAEFGFTSTYVAHTPSSAVQILRDIRINLVIADAELKALATSTENEVKALSGEEMLKLSGFDFVSRLRHSPHSPNPYIPVIMMADVLEAEQLQKARDAGVNEVLPKPLNAPDLCERLTAVIDSPRMFITADTYKGPCRRKERKEMPPEQDRRKTEVRVIRHNEST